MDRQLLEAFLKEGWDGLGQLESVLDGTGPPLQENRPLVRTGPALRSIKANAAFLGLRHLAALADTVEQVIGGLSTSRIDWSQEVSSLLVKAVAGMRELLECLEATGEEGEPSHPEILQSLNSLLDRERPAEKSGAAAEDETPAQSADTKSTGTGPSAPARHTSRDESPVLVVDDSLFFRHLVRASLESAGYDVTVAENPEKALELINSGQEFRAVVSEVEMPGFDGFTLAKRIRSDAQAGRLPLIALSRLSRESAEPRALAAGFDRFLTKFNSTQFLAALGEACAGGETGLRASA